MSKKVMCPYCGCEMQPRSDVGHWWYYCQKCFASSPTSAMSKLMAHKYALRRYQPENRVLTLHEALTMPEGIAIWREDRDRVERWVDTRVFKEQISPSFHSYGRIIRCWLRKPTEEERKAVPWE